MASLTISALFTVFCLFFEYGIGKYTNDIGHMIWPDQYHIKYEKLDVINGAIMDVSMWYAGKYNMTRKDFNGGTVKRFYENGTEYSIIPAVDNNQLTTKCLQKNYRHTLNMLPLLFDNNFKLSGKEKFDEKEVWVWKKKLPHVKETFYIYQSNGYDIPFRLISKRFDEKTAKKTKHTITNFYFYSGEVTKQDISIDGYTNKARCQRLHENEERPETSFDLDSVFETYKKRYNKNYTNAIEHKKRQEIFQTNLRKVMEHNSKNLSYRMGLNQFSDMTSEESRRLNCVSTSDSADRGTYFLYNKVEELQKVASEYPEEMDLRLKGVVTPVKNQLQCGSCWAFATTAAVEGAIALRNGGRLLHLSEQSLVDCAWGFECDGCNGGELSGSFRYVYFKGLPTVADYGTYASQEGHCHLAKTPERFRIKGFGRITPRNELALKAALNNYGPVAVGIYATEKLLMYEHGVFYDPKCDSSTSKSINHAVTVVGYGVRDGETYWIVKNSWGNTWGQDGYILMSANNNNCFVEDEGYYAVS